MSLRVVLEVTPKRSFASALDWPGWARAGRTPDDAVETLLAYVPRFARVARHAGLAFEPPKTARGIEIVETLTGTVTTEFGAPGVAAAAEVEPVTPADERRLLALLGAAWWTFDTAARRAEGVTLATGPRGGGRTLEKMIGHVRDAEAAYLRRLGARPPSSADDDQARSLARLRERFRDTVTAVVAGDPIEDPTRTKEPWSPRYAVRRAAWHVLDHAWELEDRSAT